MNAEDVYEWMKSSQFEKIAGVTVTKKVLGRGQQGFVLDAGDKVVKVSADKDEAEVSANLIDKNMKNVWKIYGAYAIKPNGVGPYYVVIGEKLRLFPRVGSYLQELAEAVEELVDEGILKKDDEYFETAIYDAGGYKAIVDQLKLNGAPKPTFAIANGMRELNKAKIDWHDLHEGNVMLRGSEPVIIDLGLSSGPTKRVKLIEKRA